MNLLRVSARGRTHWGIRDSYDGAMPLRIGDVSRPAGWPLISLLWLLAVAGLVWVQWTRLADPTYPGMDWQDPHQLTDFRDAVWLPGRTLLEGGNPYDTEAMKAARPWAQEFNLYAPAWLLLAGAFGGLPFTASALVYLVLGAALLVLFLWVTIRLSAPELTAIALPLGVIWSVLWSPTRYALQNGATFLVMLGAVLVLRGLVDADGRPHGPRPLGHRALALGVALALIKPQFGLPLALLLVVAGRGRAVVRGVVWLALASLPALLLCVRAAGGVGGFVDSVVRNLAYSGSPDSPTGLGSVFNGRIDYLGMLARFGVVDQPSWLPAVVGLALVALAAVVVLWAPGEVTVLATASAAMLLGVVHQPYDVVPLMLVVLVGLGRLLPSTARGGAPGLSRMDRTETTAWVAGGLPVLHLHAASLLVVPGLDRRSADLVDVIALTVALLVGLTAAVRQSDGALRGRRVSRTA